MWLTVERNPQGLVHRIRYQLTLGGSVVLDKTWQILE